MPNTLLPGPLAHVTVCVSGVIAAPVRSPSTLAFGINSGRRQRGVAQLADQERLIRCIGF